MAHIPQHAWRLAEQQGHGQVDGVVAEIVVSQQQMLILGGLTHHRIGTALPLADGLELIQPLSGHRQHVAFLGLVRPDLHGGHARIVIGHHPQLELAATATVMHQLRQGIGDPTSAHVMNPEHRVLLTPGGTLVDHLLAAPLHLRVAALHRGEIQVLGTGAAGHGGGRAAPQADKHGGTTQHHQGSARRVILLLHMAGTDVAHTAGDHDGFVITPQLSATGGRHLRFIGAEIATQVGAAEFVIEGGGTDGTLQHDIQG